jgi:hypothetical protein
MTAEERGFLKQFFQSVNDQPLEPDDPRYVQLYTQPSADPVELLARGIEWTPGESVQLFSGFRGTGKSTELRRLRRRLKSVGYLVLLLDVKDYLNVTTPIDVSDFLMGVAGGFGDELFEQKLLDGNPANEGYWTRLANFLTRTRVELNDISGKVGVADSVEFTLKANLKNDPSFRRQLQERMAGHLGALVADVRQFFEDCVKKLKQRHGVNVEVVLLLDSIEQIRGTSVNAVEVQSSVETLFAGHAEKLHLPYVHVVYTVPPYLKVRYANLGALYAPGGVQVLPAVKLRGPHADQSTERPVFQPGLDTLEAVVRGRGDWQRLLGTRDLLDRVSLQSGGHLRDLLRILAEITRRADRLPVPADTVNAAINQLRTEFLPIADADAVWLARIAQTHKASLEDASKLPDLARFLDTHRVLCYRNASEWYDLHPVILDEVMAQIGALEARQAASPRQTDG